MNKEEKIIRKPGEILFSIFLTVFSVTAFWQAYAISGFTGLSTAGIFPMLASLAMIVCSLIITKDVFAKQPHKHSSFANGVNEILPITLIYMIVLIMAYLLAMPLIGFVLSSTAFLFISFAILWKKPIWLSAFLAVFSLAIIYLIFRTVFQVVLPQGSLIQGSILEGLF